MEPLGRLVQETTATNFSRIKIQIQQNGHSWSIVGFFPNGDFKMLAVLEDPIPHSLMVEFAQKIADKFRADFRKVGI